jgi:DUF4097 and DUF4098 domain-containing protein YvlB
MSTDAQRDILKMLAENVITVDEAERLLKALTEGQQQKQEPSFHRRKHPHGFGTGMGTMFESIGDALSDIGPMVKNTMEDVVTGIFGDDLGDLEDEDFVDIEPIEDSYEISDDTHMVIVSDWKWGPKQGDLRIQGVSGTACRIDNAETENLRIRRSATHFVIQWSGGLLNVQVPETVAKLRVRSKGGDIRVADLHCDMNVKTMGGDLHLHDLLKDFKAKTMGGDITLDLNAAWSGNAKIHTMGGDITATIPEGVGFDAEASTMGGTISVPENMQCNNRQTFPGKSSAKIHAGAENSTSNINLRTMGGDITLRKDSDEEQS